MSEKVRPVILLVVLVTLGSAGVAAADSPSVTGWSREYRQIAAESFTTQTRVPAPGFLLGLAGRFSTPSEDAWIFGSSDGKRDFLPYYTTNPLSLPLTPGREYELRFDYKVMAEADRGFQVLFYSPAGGARNDWLPDLQITGGAGATGRGLLKVRLGKYTDYRIHWNVIHKGTIAIRAITLVDAKEGSTIAREDLRTTVSGPGAGILIGGRLAAGQSDTGSVTLGRDAWLRTDPTVIALKPATVYTVELDWRLPRPIPGDREIGSLVLFAQTDPQHRRTATRMDGGGATAGRYVGGVKTGESEVPWVLELSGFGDTSVTISDLRVFEQETTPRSAAENPALALAAAPFPRLGNYQGGGLPSAIAWDGCGTVRGGLPLMSMSELDRRLAVFDIVVGVSEATSTNDPAFARRLRALNPRIVLLPYTIAAEFWYDEGALAKLADPLADAWASYARGLDSAWFLRKTDGSLVADPAWPFIRKLNISPFCPRDARGRDFIDYYVERNVTMHLENGTWDGLFVDNLFAQTNVHIENAFDPQKFDADYNRNGRRDETIPSVHEMTLAASARAMRNLRARFGDAHLVIANSGPIPEETLAPSVNGYVLEGFNTRWYPEGRLESFSEAAWCTTLAKYRSMEARTQAPRILILEGMSLHPGEEAAAAGSYRAPTQMDIRLQRMAAGTALLGDGFYEYDLFDMRSAPQFFDEQLVGADGASVDTEDGKGWLGRPHGPAMELATDTRMVRQMPGAVTVTAGRGKELVVDCGVAAGAGRRQYVLEFDWMLAETATYSPEVHVYRNEKRRDETSLFCFTKGAEGHTRVHATAATGERVAFTVFMPGPGALRAVNLHVTESRGVLFRRDFENGVVIVNPTTEPVALTDGELAGDAGRTAIRRIAGRLDRAVNNGQPVTGGLTVPAADAIVLRAEHRER